MTYFYQGQHFGSKAVFCEVIPHLFGVAGMEMAVGQLIKQWHRIGCVVPLVGFEPVGPQYGFAVYIWIDEHSVGIEEGVAYFFYVVLQD
jgi:hypothetical protein